MSVGGGQAKTLPSFPLLLLLAPSFLFVRWRWDRCREGKNGIPPDAGGALWGPCAGTGGGSVLTKIASTARHLWEGVLM